MTASNAPAAAPARPRWLRWMPVALLLGALWWTDRQHGAHDVRLLLSLPPPIAATSTLTLSIQHPDGRERLRAVRSRSTVGPEWVVETRLERGDWRVSLFPSIEGLAPLEGRCVVADDEYVEVAWDGPR